MALHFGCLSLAVTELPLALMAALRMAIQPFVGGAPGTWRAALYNMYMYIVTVTLSLSLLLISRGNSGQKQQQQQQTPTESSRDDTVSASRQSMDAE